MAYDFEEQEQLESLKAWWARYGNLIMGVIIVILLGFASWNGWKWYQQKQAAGAAAYYEALENAAEQKDLAKVGDAAGALLGEYGGTDYAPRGALLAAYAYLSEGDRQSARAQLEWVIGKSKDPTLIPVARLRLAAVLLDDEAFDEALRVLDAGAPTAFEGLFADRRGDALAGKGDRAAAAQAYREALAKLSGEPSLQSTVQLKLDALGAE